MFRIKLIGLVFMMWNVVISSTYPEKRRQYINEGISEENNDNFDTSRYKFAYGVEDHKTGDFKMHQEERDGDLVKGEYTVAEADGTLRTVRYTADKHNGFHAVISKAGEARQEFPAASPPSALASASYHHHRSIKVPPASLNHHDVLHPLPNHPHHLPHLPLKKYITDLPQFAKQYAAKHNKVIESFAADNAAHYQSVNIDTNAQNTQYGINLSQEKLREEKLREESAKKFAKHMDIYANHHQPIFHLQTPQGFKKNEENIQALPLTNQNVQVHPVHEEVNEALDALDRGHSVEEPEWKQNEQLNNYKGTFEAHFEKFRRPSSNNNNHGAFSYMNFEGETRNGYELQHNSPQMQRKELNL